MIRLALLFLISFPAFVAAAPSWSGTLSPSAPGTHPPLSPRKLEFTVTWKNSVAAGRITLDFAPSGISKSGAMVVTSTSASSGFAATLYPYSASLWSEVLPATLRPRYFRSSETTSSETETITNHYGPAGVKSRRVTTPNDGLPQTKDGSFAYPAFDLASAILFVRSQRLATGDTVNLLVHPFHHPYLANFKVTGREKRDGKPVIKIETLLRKLNRKTLEPAPYKKLKGTPIIWISDDAARLPVELRLPLFIGDVRAVLVSDSPHP